MPVMFSGHVPLLEMVTFKSLKTPVQTDPKSPLSATIVEMVGCPPAPWTGTAVKGRTGSLLAMLITPVFAPGLDGSNRMGTCSEIPGAIVNGKETTVAVRKSVEFELMDDTTRLQAPLLLIVMGRSRKVPGQVSPKSPVFAISVAIEGVPAIPVTGIVTVGFTGSSLGTISVPVFTPLPEGVNVT